MKYELDNEKGGFSKVENFAVGDFVAYCATIGGPIISRGHRIVAFKMIDPAKEIFKVGITKIPGFVPIESIVPDGHCYEVPNESREKCLIRLAKTGESIPGLIDSFLEQPIEDAFEMSVAIYRKIDRKTGVLMAQAVVRRMEREIG